AQSLTADVDKASGKVDLAAGPGLSLFGRYGWRDLATFDQPPIPLPAGGGGNGAIYVRNKALALGAARTASDDSLLEIRFGWSSTQGGKNPPALAATVLGVPGLPSDSRIAGGLLSENVTGYTSGTSTPVFGRQSTNPQWQYPTVWNPKVNYTRLLGRQSMKAGYEYQQIAVEVQDVNPLYGLDSYAGQFTRPAGATANNVYNLADFMLGLRSQYAISTLFVAEMRQ